ncbi:MAG: DNA-binding response regulator [Desulfobacteraceae bacterium]|nr:MAG: DNA-binding response regulator [Desulfobacteraceae bacterium]
MHKAIIADDERELRNYLKTMLKEAWPELVICGEAANGNEALELVSLNRPQIAFLDIKMPGLSGMDVAEKIAHICRIVFVTAYDQYAVEAFEKEAVDYLVKPVMKERLEQTISRLKRQLEISDSPVGDISELVGQVIKRLNDKEKAAYLRWIRIQVRDDTGLIPVDDVFYFKAEDKYTLVMTKEGESLIKKSIKELAEELDPDHFWQIHRGSIVNVSKIDKVSRSLTGRGVLKLKGSPELLTVSRNYLHYFKQM